MPKRTASLSILSSPVLFGDYETYHFDFEDSSFSNFTVSTCSSSGTECWLRGAGRQNTLSGPQEDHTFGAPQGNQNDHDGNKHNYSVGLLMSGCTCRTYFKGHIITCIKLMTGVTCIYLLSSSFKHI